MTGSVARALVAATCLSVAGVQAQSAPTEYEVKAAYLFNFGKFVEWPASQKAGARTFDLCVLGKDPFGAALDRVVAGGVMEGKPVQARRLTDPAGAPACRILFIGAADERQVSEVLAAPGIAGVLTVGDTPTFLSRGGIIRFVTQGARVRFEVNLSRAQRAGLALSSELLRVAAAVHKD
jgi:hypothetical protein